MILFAAIVPPPAAVQQMTDHLRGVEAGPREPRPPEDVLLPIARFGNTTLGDAERLVDTLRAASGEWVVPSELSLAGGQVVATPSERLLEVQVSGDVERLAGLANCVKESAEQQRFLLDRRDFRPFLTLATARAGTDDGFDAAAAALNAFEGRAWPVEQVSIRKQTYGHSGASEELAAIPLVGG
jgi:2'-5' RNA ligase